MSDDIKQIPTNELKADRIASLHDIRVCELTLLHGAEDYSGGSVQERLDVNRRIIEIIDAELERRRRPPSSSSFAAAWNRRATAGGWIAVGERLPELNKDDASAHVLVYTKRGQFAAYRTEGEWYVSLYDDEVAIEVTHWQPLPPPPGTDEPAPAGDAHVRGGESLGAKLIAWAADEERATFYNQSGELICKICGAVFVWPGTEHSDDCLHVAARKLQERGDE